MTHLSLSPSFALSVTSSPSKPLVRSILVDKDDKTAVISNVPWLEIVPEGPCDVYLASSPAIQALVPKIALVVRDCVAKAEELEFSLEDEGLLVPPRNELVAIVAYTHDLKLGKEQNLFYQLNTMLRLRGAEEREEMMRTWGTFMHYIMSGLSKLSDVAGVCYRGFPHMDVAKKHYRHGRPVQWGAFSSATRSLKVAKAFAGIYWAFATVLFTSSPRYWCHIQNHHFLREGHYPILLLPH